MKETNESPYEALEKIFHEPNRLAIVSALCASGKELPFTELRETCGLTDGNLNRHLKVLQEAKIVSIKKAFIDDKPRTTAKLTATGLRRFNDYLKALEAVLGQARDALPAEERKRTPIPGARLATT